MPSPLEIFLDPITLTIIALYVVLIGIEAFFPARNLPPVKYWKVKGIFSFLFFVLLSTYLPFLYSSLLPAAPWINVSHLSPISGGILGILLYEFGLYFWHWAMHKSTLLWRTFHQLHHSAERLDTFGAFYFSPMDMIGFTLLGTLCFSFLLGLSPQAITVFLLVTNFFNAFQHANIKTPVWLGYIVQRPESHTYHHAKGIHQGNYSDLPIFDILFGTFHNPKDFEHETGFYQGASSKITDMLIFKDVSSAMEETE